jgi:hypothetical protein
MNEKRTILLKEFLRLFLVKVLVYDLILIVLIFLSFLITKGFSANVLSERFIWTGLGVMLIGGLMAFSEVGNKNYGWAIFTSAQASVLTDYNIEIRQNLERKFNPMIRFIAVAAILFINRHSDPGALCLTKIVVQV